MDAEPLIAAMGLQNPEGRDGVPHPATVVLDPEGRVILASTFVNYKKREAVETILAAIRDGGAADAAPISTEKTPTIQIAWPEAARVAPGGEATIAWRLAIPEGAHVYAPGEEISVPMALSLTPPEGVAAEIAWPEPVRKTLSLGEGLLYVGDTQIDVRLTAAPGLAPGDQEIPASLTWQVCTDTVCAMPRTEERAISLTIAP